MQILFQSQEGDIIGEIECIENQKRKNFALCSNDVMVLVIKSKIFLEKLDEYEDV